GEAVPSRSPLTRSTSYIPYGEVFVEESSAGWQSPYYFNAKELDNETGLYYYGARYLDPTGAMWLSVDPLFEKYAGMSPYNYCAGNPVKLVDPDGRDYARNDNGEIVYFEKDLSDRLKIGEHFQYKGGAGVYLGKTYEDKDFYYGLFNDRAKVSSKEAKILKTIDHAVSSHIKSVIGTNEAYGKTDMYGIPLDFPSTKFNLYVDLEIKDNSLLREENQFHVEYAQKLGKGTFFAYPQKNAFGSEVSMPDEPVNRHGFGCGSDEKGYYMTFDNSHGMHIINLKFNESDAKNFMNRLNRLFPKLHKSFEDRKKRIGF
ncbi:MAG: RHS repeat-associated core domain-containing protein, partial [Paludibacteraceae bacterium]|nr:RHS repeat-associated core domain-containing protein [Paludibacteraceae bacterium]